MIRCRRPRKPKVFDRLVGRPGRAWLRANPGSDDLPDFWKLVRPNLARGFEYRCAYTAMLCLDGTVDHFVSVKANRRQAYRWSNYRYAAHWINSSKQNADDEVLDPFEIGDDWFEVIMPSMQLVVTDAVPARYKDIAEHTLTRLHLGNDERVVRQREYWYREYQAGTPLDRIDQYAPLLARAIRKALGIP